MALHDAAIRDTARTILLSAATIAGNRVRREWIDDPPDTDLPRLAVMIDSSGQSLSAAGGAPRYDVTGDLVIVAYVAEANEADAINHLDTLAEQARDAVLCSATLFGMAAIRSWRLGRKFGTKGKLIIGEARIVLSLTWQEDTPPPVADLPIFTGADIRSGQGPAIGADVNT